MKYTTPIIYMVASVLLMLISYTWGYVMMCCGIVGIMAYHLIIKHKGINDIAVPTLVIPMACTMISIFIAPKIEDNSLKNEGGYYIAVQCTEKKTSTSSKGKIQYHLSFHNYHDKYGNYRKKIITCRQSTYDKATNGKYYIIAEPLFLSSETLWKKDPTQEEIDKMRNGIFLDGNGQEININLNECWIKKYESHFLKAIFIFLIMYFIGSIFNSWISTMAYICAFVSFSLYGYGWSALIISTPTWFCTTILCIISTPLMKNRLRKDIKREGAYITTGIAICEKADMKIKVRTWEGQIEEFDVHKSKEEPGYGSVIVAIPLGLQHTPIVLEYSKGKMKKELADKLKNGIFMAPGKLPEKWETIEDDNRLRRKITSK